MKDQLISSVQTILRDKYLTILLAIFLIFCLGILVYIGLSIHPSELQVVVHYTSFGTTNFYRDKWYYLVSFGVFVVIMATMQCILTYKILQAKDRSFAIAFVWLGFILAAVSTTLFYQILKIASLS